MGAILRSYIAVLGLGLGVIGANAQELPEEIKAKYPNGKYVSTQEYKYARASCVPCKNKEGDPKQESEAIPFRLDPKTATVICRRDPERTKNDDEPCLFNRAEVSIDNLGKRATINYMNRSEAVIIQLTGDILTDQGKLE